MAPSCHSCFHSEVSASSDTRNRREEQEFVAGRDGDLSAGRCLRREAFDQPHGFLFRADGTFQLCILDGGK